MIRFVPEVRSTNAELRGRLEGGGHVAEGEWLVANRQTDGHGRSGRKWCDGAGNFMGSTLVHPAPGDPPAFTLALVAGLAVREAVAKHLKLHPDAATLTLGRSRSARSIAVMLKWPNDILVEGAKLAGILLEGHAGAVIVGIGVNLVVAPTIDRRQTISLAQLGASSDRDGFARDLARQFALDLGRWRDFGLAPIVRRWCAAAHPEGTPLVVETSGGALHGRFAGLSDEGALRLRLDDGSLREVLTGEVRLTGEQRPGMAGEMSLSGGAGG